MLEEMIAFLSTNPQYSAVYSGYYHIDANGNITGKNMKGSFCYNPRRFINLPNREYLVAQHCNFGPAFLYRASACRKAGEFDPECEGIEDIDYSLRIAQVGKVKWLPKLLYKYRLHANSMTGREKEGVVSYANGRKRFWKKVARINWKLP